ncbi:PspC domain-containing protein [Geodermatophilus marinus]|uniref:PspC domain-containing protein n=1 Tax=Geodermatophilus sp. LHW52908 TaxID=2303986 RepID=UPI000E3C44F6|nr:PspC domain-containing protein [Geodermatophilus sp. LHW52908]RFU23432.1 PspC domain-containing protein [Geodermatophilus sp. LHW52908]
MTSAVPPAPPFPDPPPPAPPARPPLQRSRSDRVLGGVAGGLADYTGIDALLWRVAFVALTLAGGTGVLVYALLWLLTPAAPAVPGAPARRAAGPPAPRSPVPRITVAGLLIVVGVLVLLSRLGDWDPGPRGFLGTALLVVGLGLVALSVTGVRRGRGGLIGLGVLLSFALAAASAEPWEDVDGGIGDRSYRPATAESVRPVYHLGVGDTLLDLSRVDVSDLDEPIETRVDAGIGNVEVLVPDSADVRVEVESGIGDVDVLDLDDSGGFSAGEGSASWTGDGDPEIVLTIHAGLGDVEVDRA